mgnify:CR=1 FL=1
MPYISMSPPPSLFSEHSQLILVFINFDKWLQSQRHRVILSNGERAGFFIGDAAGVGKGRQVSRKLSCSDSCILFMNC